MNGDTTNEQPRRLASLEAERFDLLVVGGGISGVTLAWLAAEAGLRVALCERADFGAGTSGRSSRLLHGGFRYLAQGRLHLVHQALRAQQEWAALAPHLVQPMPFLLPFWAASRHPDWLLRAAGGVYGRLSPAGRANVSSIGRDELRELEPCLRGAEVGGALRFLEHSVHDARLVVEVALAARRAGALICNRVAFESLTHSGAQRQVTGACLRDVATGQRLSVRTRTVVSAMGPWTNQLTEGPPRVRLSRGTHIVLPARRLPLQHAVAFFSRRDGRALFARPADLDGWPATIVGTTEVEHTGSPDHVEPQLAEIRDLIEAAASHFPAWRLRHDDVVHVYAGVRPLGRSHRSASKTDRRYTARWEATGLLTLWGGKLTLALEGARLALRELRTQSRALGLPSFELPAHGTLPPLDPLRATPWSGVPVTDRLRRLGVPASSIRHVVATHGARTGDLLWLMERDRRLCQPIVAGAPHVLAEAAFAARAEMATTADDFLFRRSQLGLRLACMRGARAATPPALAQIWPSAKHPDEATTTTFRRDNRS